MYTLINGSSKIKSSNSNYFLEYISNYLKDYKIYSLKDDNYKKILQRIKHSDTIVLAFPLYVDSPNTITLNFLDYVFDHNINLKNKKLYVIINCGFKEGKQNLTALNIIKNWCIKREINYSGSLLIGAGEVVGNKHYKFISRKAIKKIHDFAIDISEKNSVKDKITTIDILSNKMYCKLANISWNKSARKNKLSKKDLSLE